MIIFHIETSTDTIYMQVNTRWIPYQANKGQNPSINFLQGKTFLGVGFRILYLLRHPNSSHRRWRSRWHLGVLKRFRLDTDKANNVIQGNHGGRFGKSYKTGYVILTITITSNYIFDTNIQDVQEYPYLISEQLKIDLEWLTVLSISGRARRAWIHGGA